MNKKAKFENALWEKYNEAFMKMEDTLRSCKTEKHLMTTRLWIDEVLTNYKEAETEGKPSRTREIAEEYTEDYMMKKIETFNEIYFEMLRKITKEKTEDLKCYEKDWSDAKNGKCPCC
jgi:hypothetical protein